MLAKRYRLNYRETKKALARGKPFFASGLTAFVFVNHKSTTHRCAIVIWGKTARLSVIRNFFRRRFFEQAAQNIALPAKNGSFLDVVITIKKWNILDHKQPESVARFCAETRQLFTKIFS